MAPRRDRRRFGPGPYLRGLEPAPDPVTGRRAEPPWDCGRWPFTVPGFAALEWMRFDRPITLLAGDNGAGKSTILETLAAAIGFGEEGGELERKGVLPAVPHAVAAGDPDDPEAPRLRPAVTLTKPKGGFFLRAESFFNVAAFTDSGDKFAPDLSLYGGTKLHEQSHGESFLALASNRFGAAGIYFLDEPEAALSVTGQLALLAIVARAANGGAQFVIATHSPILLACPGAVIYELTEDGAAEAAWDELEAVRLTRSFLGAPERFLRAAIEE